jgi:predicted RNase H-like nuclease
VTRTAAVGVDGCAQGWVAVALGPAFVRAWAAPSLTALLADVGPEATVGVDMPIGLLASGWRTADRAAAVLAGVRRSSVFAVPPRPVLSAPDLAEANVMCRQLTGSGMSAQMWALRHKVLEADAYAVSRELFEVHPELVFQRLAGQALAYRKKSWNGQGLRRNLLAAAGVVLPDDLGAAGVVGSDDVLDAAAVAWCALRIADGTARHVPDPVQDNDENGRPIAIWF